MIKYISILFKNNSNFSTNKINNAILMKGTKYTPSDVFQSNRVLYS